ncbi:hypothetical protein Pmani_003132 [Petrolisthes manimaculis]|uniref:PPM-type phosphatase domain-containing protein n=1 Tax=Petrolisthes manimaculis TaxID=1843537 RepID=A0AAE1QJJ7_9EUCA|nr:hypothetical protein Pmani_019111 [Petrolisthes manimaculis]KAK4326337.1 hypothetical protein Pmani_003132 [Petrolisthes manimaculis]
MLSRFKTALYNVVGSFDPGDGATSSLGPGVTSGHASSSGGIRTGLLPGSSKEKSVRFPYTRPHFLQLGSEDEIQVTADHAIRPIICPRDITRLPWSTGYAETINAGKSRLNEDQAMVHVGLLTRPVTVHSPTTLQASPTSPIPSPSQQKESTGDPHHLVNGHGEEENNDGGETWQKHTVQLLPKHLSSNTSLSVSPATELKEDFRHYASSHSEPASSSDHTSSSDHITSSDHTTSSDHGALSVENPSLNDDKKESDDSSSSLKRNTNPTDQTHLSQQVRDIPLTSQPQTTTQTISSQPLTTSPSTSTTPQSKTVQQPTTTPESSTIPHSSNTKPQSTTTPQPLTTTISLPYYLFGVFDGHAGWGAAVAAANQLHHIVHEKLCDIIDILIPDPHEAAKERGPGPMWPPEKEVTLEAAVTGALEHAFWQMDGVIGEDRLRYQLSGGCTACVALFIHGRLFLANAGDSRATMALREQPEPMSFDFTPETETQRIRKLGAMHPELLGGEFTHLDFIRRPARRDLGKRVMYRDHYMTGWAYKTLTQDDLKYPLVCGEGKRSRVLATIGVTRGFGDHDLKAQCTSIPIKPFLTPEPEVRIFDIALAELTDGDVLILATDGLWDITSNEKAVLTVGKSLAHFPPHDQEKYKYRYTSAAQDLVMGSRGKLRERNWRTSDDKHATIDDISVFVIPIRSYQEEHRAWLAKQETGWGKDLVENKNNGDGIGEQIISVADLTVNRETGRTENLTSPGDSCDLSPHEDYFKSESHGSAQIQHHSDQSVDAT